MGSPFRYVVQLLVALAATVGAALCWAQVRSLVDIAPVTEGQPRTISVVYDPPMMVLALVLATTAGVLTILGVAGLRRRVSRITLDTYTP